MYYLTYIENYDIGKHFYQINYLTNFVTYLIIV